MSSRQSDVVVVGNGVLGLSTAVEVGRRAPEVRIAVVGPRARPAAASTAAGAVVNCFGEVTAGTAGHPAARAKFAIARQALDSWPRWLDMLADATGPAGEVVHTPGTTVVLSGRSGQVAVRNFEAMRAALVEHGESHEVLDPCEVVGSAPEPGARPSHAVHLHREGAVDARAVVGALETAAGRLGVDLVDDTVHDWARQRARQVYEHLGVALPPEVVVVVRALTDPLRAGAVAALRPGRATPPRKHGRHANTAGGRERPMSGKPPTPSTGRPVRRRRVPRSSPPTSSPPAETPRTERQCHGRQCWPTGAGPAPANTRPGRWRSPSRTG